MADDPSAADRNVEIWKIKKLIKSLEAARGNGTSMISLIIPPKDQISRVAKMLADEFGTASNIKSRVNRLSVLGAITSVQQRLKLYNKVPPNGLVVYCGTIVTEEGKEKKVNIDFEPFKPINTSLYLCDNKFHTEALTALLSDDSKFGFIVIDGSGALFGTLQGNTREVLHKFTVDLPKKSGDKVNVAGLVLAGSADFKTELSQSDMFDQRLQSKVLKLVDISYGGENGFNQAIELSTEALEMGAVEILIVYENLDIMRYVLHCQGTEEEKILYLTPEQEKDKSHFTDKETGQEHELIESMPLLEWFANNYKKFGATLEIFPCHDAPKHPQWISGLSAKAKLKIRASFSLGASMNECQLDSHLPSPHPDEDFTTGMQELTSQAGISQPARSEPRLFTPSCPQPRAGAGGDCRGQRQRTEGRNQYTEGLDSMDYITHNPSSEEEAAEGLQPWIGKQGPHARKPAECSSARRHTRSSRSGQDSSQAGPGNTVGRALWGPAGGRCGETRTSRLSKRGTEGSLGWGKASSGPTSRSQPTEVSIWPSCGSFPPSAESNYPCGLLGPVTLLTMKPQQVEKPASAAKVGDPCP
ncbi:PREDICTED: eukaryotic peptide chain release factor subunit 1 [Elephantulus edwardii]|uniref:eukaryotic peptide chain release factor subunit 1 n=1 Tax=Elephantulus edwardii TaxID=28737 RepID=UPI0003F0EFF5|nr:PREDICTED: eukaryotic peptide chain release factor subunit 1 [Elephantulus edwardii]